MPEAEPTRDWTGGPAKWFAIGVLATLSTGALGWSIVRAASGTEPRVRSSPERDAHADAFAGTPIPAAPTDVQAAWPAAKAPVTSLAPSATPGPKSDPSTTNPLARTINLNSASAAELELLPGIGPALAQRIIEARQQHGGFKRVDELDDVHGIGPKLLAKLRDRVSVE